MLSRLNLRKFRSIGFYIFAWSGFLLLYLFVRFLGREWVLPMQEVFGITCQFALLSGLSQGIYEVFVLSDDHFHRPLMESVIFRSLFHICMILCNLLIIYLLWKYAMGEDMFSFATRGEITALLETNELWAFLGFAFFSSHSITFIRSVNKKFGTRVFFNAVLGKSQEPTEEERVFMFIDLRSATTLAEDLGHFAYSSFLRDYFRLLSNCCMENGGEVYQFAGDGAILTWTTSSCRHRAKPLTCYRDLIFCFHNTRYRFERKYGTYPQFKVAFHVGRVIATEVGNFGSEMAYHGDALNTTARLQAMCNLLKKDALGSETFVRKMPSLEGFRAENQGSFQLKGKKGDLEVFCLE